MKVMTVTPVSAKEDQIGKAIVDSAYTVHRALGPGLLEHVYLASDSVT